jgi:hypothetical protein
MQVQWYKDDEKCVKKVSVNKLVVHQDLQVTEHIKMCIT